MVSILKSKKGGIPAINEIVQIVMGILPTPIKILLFLLLITTIASFILPLFLGLFGYACVMEGSQVELYQVPLEKFMQKTGFDLERTVGNWFNPIDFVVEDDTFPSGNKNYLKIPDECYVTRDVNGSMVTGYTGGCTNCPVYTDGFLEDVSSFFRINRHKTFCIGDGVDIWTGVAPYSSICEICEPKYPYYYNHTECLTFGQDQCYFTITDTSLVSIVGTDYRSQIYLENIQSLNGVKRAQDSSDIINIQCASENAPSLFVFSFELFNRYMWVLLVISGALVGFALKWYSLFR